VTGPARARGLDLSHRADRFPSKSYGNVEGIAWLSEDTPVAVSDEKKSRQPDAPVGLTFPKGL
jgi:hypothetical protein